MQTVKNLCYEVHWKYLKNYETLHKAGSLGSFTTVFIHFAYRTTWFRALFSLLRLPEWYYRLPQECNSAPPTTTPHILRPFV